MTGPVHPVLVAMAVNGKGTRQMKGNKHGVKTQTSTFHIGLYNCLLHIMKNGMIHFVIKLKKKILFCILMVILFQLKHITDIK